MRKSALVLVLLFLSIVSYADKYKVFWRCADGHLEAIEPHENNADKEIQLVLNYMPKSGKEFSFSPIDSKSLADLPAWLNHEDFLMLGSKNRLYMVCVGQVVLSPHYPQGKVVFDARRNAYGCPLIPEGCSEDS
ncbi:MULTISPECIES: hypothetical protein [unclassified Legionella]|uniref:hypothetical protein n=1 Tax=unclassified Legionella TaxID=2622702 RepID=UPI001055B16C|nr:MULTISPECIES: hypothetical protein [unclassified Legionella]MDI9819477.1 hypothetical protein [Legionella sp. PL877]